MGRPTVWPTFVVINVAHFLGTVPDDGAKRVKTNMVLAGHRLSFFFSPLMYVCTHFCQDFTPRLRLEMHVVGYHMHEENGRARTLKESIDETRFEWVQLPDGVWRKVNTHWGREEEFYSSFISHHLDDDV